MKKNLFLVSMGLFLGVALNLHAAITSPATAANYVVIGAFAVQDHALIWVEKAKKLDLDAEYSLNPTRNLYYVYVLQTTDRAQAMSRATELRKGSPFSDTWVYFGSLGLSEQVVAGNDVNPVSEEKIEVVNTPEVLPAIVEEPVKMDSVKKDSVQGEAVRQEMVQSPVISQAEEDPSKGKSFYFSVFSKAGNLKGEVTAIDAERLTKLGTYESNTKAAIKQPNKTGQIQFQCNVFGYRKGQIDLNYNSPEMTEGVKIENGSVVIPFEMIRLKKGDFAILYNVFFFKDAAIMRPESKYEVNALKDMMNENPNLKIRLHGHTNGGSAGKVIEMGDTKNFFSLSGSRDGFGSAKELSEKRAGTIREYLLSEGIAPDRIEVEAWGGKKPIHDKKSKKAHENVRVEVEILAD